MSSAEDITERKLIDRLAPDDLWGLMHGLLATTFDLQPEFLEMDFLPSLFRLGAWDDRSWATRIGLERKLAELEAAVVIMEARRYNVRPRSLRLQLIPANSPHGTSLHAKVTLIVFDQAVRLIVGSANLTEPGYRKNREAVAVITATEKNPAETAVVRDALTGMEAMLADWLTPDANRIISRAKEIIAPWGSGQLKPDNHFQWSGKTTTLWRAFLSNWPSSEPVRKLTIASPFWSEDAGTTVRAFLAELKSRNLLHADIEVLLLTEAFVDTKKQYRPVLPLSYAAFDWKGLGVKVSAQAVSGEVLPEELGGMEGFTGTRPLHAKIVVMEGAKTGLAYLGSANFTAHGWGFLKRETAANIEAGVLLRRRAGSKALQSMLPPLIGLPVLLGAAKPTDLSPPESSPDDPPWPFFIKEVALSTAASGDALQLNISVQPESHLLKWSAVLLGPETIDIPVLVSDEEANNPIRTNYQVPLPPDVLNRILLDQEVTIRWSECLAGRRVPVNVDFAARLCVPISPSSPRIEEGSLLSYYQGQIAWDDLFPVPIAMSLARHASLAAPESGVDKSKIQSYQIRDFVEALSGIRGDLKAVSQAEPSMRLALLGPVSPVALAKTVREAVESGRRTATAAGFQLVEILACLKSVRGLKVPQKLTQTWMAHLDQAHAQVAEVLTQLETKFPQEFTSNGSFARYRKTILTNRKKHVVA